MKRVGVALAFVLASAAHADERQDAATAGRQSVWALSDVMRAWKDAKPVDCASGAPEGDKLAKHLADLVAQLSASVNDPRLGETQRDQYRQRLLGVAPFAAEGQLALADGYHAAGCDARALEAYQVVLDRFTGPDFAAYRERAELAMHSMGR